MSETLTVTDILKRLDEALATGFPGPVWVRGEIAGLNRTSRGAMFLKLVDTDQPESALTVFARGMVASDVEQELLAAKVGSLRNGIEVRVEGTVGHRSGDVRLAMLRVDPEFIAGKLALDRDAILARLRQERLDERNRSLPVPSVPLRVGLVTSVGSAAHADLLHQLAASGRRFRVRTVSASMQGGFAVESLVGALARLASEAVDVVAVVRGGGSKLDLATFDSEEVARAIAAMPHPVVTGIGHEIDKTIADEMAAVAVKTPTAVGEWLVSRVDGFADRVDRARVAIRDAASDAMRRTVLTLDGSARELAGVRARLARERDRLDHFEVGVAERSRLVVSGHRDRLDSLGELVATVGLEPTLRRGFALVTRPNGAPVSRSAGLSEGDHVKVRMSDGTVGMIVEKKT